MFGRSPPACIDELARGSLAQHMRDCETARVEDRQDREVAAAEVKRELQRQNDIRDRMHTQNQIKFTEQDKAATSRFVKIMFLLLSTTVAAAGALAMEIIKGGGIHGG